MKISSQRIQTPVVRARGAVPAQPAAPDARAAARPGGDGSVGAPPAGAGAASHVARLDALADALLERLRHAAADAPESEGAAFREAAEGLESGLARLRAGLADGTLGPADVQRGFRNALGGAREALEAARGGGGEAAEEPPATADVVRARFDGLAASVLARVEALAGTEGERGALAAGIAEAFQSATARLDAALFDPRTGDPIDRGTYRQLFSASLGALQEQLGQLFGDEGPSGRSVLYGADSRVEGVAPPAGRVDLAG